MSEHACIVADSVGRKRFELCRALRHVPGCTGAAVALRFDRYLDGSAPLAHGYESLCDTADTCHACLAMARVAFALFTTVRGDHMAGARDAYIRAFCNDAALVLDALIRAKAAEAEAAWG